MPKRDELYVVNPKSGARAAVPRAHFEKTLKPDGWAIDPAGPSAVSAPPQTVRAAERAVSRAAEQREAAAGGEGASE